MQQIEWEDFQRVELRVGTVLSAEVNEKANKPAYVLQVDLGELGIKQSSAQLTAHYQCAQSHAAGQHEQRPAGGHRKAEAQGVLEAAIGGQSGREGRVGARREAHRGAENQQGGQFGSVHRSGVAQCRPSM